MEKKVQVLKLSVIGISIFVIGLLLGFSIRPEQIRSVRGLLLAANRNTSTSSNASDSNASSANASDSNASSANASDANASTNDGIMSLDSFSLASSSAKQGENLKINIKTLGACNSGVSIVFKDDKTGSSFTATVNSLETDPYIVIPKNADVTTYKVTDILLTGINSDLSTFTLHCTDNMFECGTISNNVLNVVAADTADSKVEPLSLTSIKINEKSAKVGSSVTTSLVASEELTDAKYTFTNDNNESFTVKVGPFGCKCVLEFTIPSNVKVGKYNLTSVNIKSKDSTKTYSKNSADALLEDITIDIIENDNQTYIFDNNTINSDSINKIMKAKDGTKITINADSNSIIKEEIFKAIKGKDRTLIINYKDNQIVFEGKNINDPKTIDVNMEVEIIDSTTDISKLVKDGVLVTFPDNGDLPGKAKIYLKETDALRISLSDNSYIYFYNEDSKDFCEVDSKVVNKDGYYQFEITHNSRYVMVNKKLDKKLLAKDTSDVVSFQKSNKIYLLLISLGVLVIVLVTVIIVFLKNKKKNNIEKNI